MFVKKLKISKDYWKNQVVLVTGGHGFVGKNTINFLRVIQKKIKFKILNPKKKDLDFTNYNSVFNYFKKKKPTIVLHFAGMVGGIGINKIKQGEFFYNNALMGINAIHCSYLHNVKKFVGLAAGCGYPENIKIPFAENDFWNGLPDKNSLGYSMAKKNLIIQAWSYKSQYNFNSVILLPANIYGPHDNFNLETSHVVPALIKKFIIAKKKNQKKILVWGSGKASREFLFIEDLVKAIIVSAERINEVGPFNVGVGKETKIIDLVKLIKKITKFKGKIEFDNSKPDGQIRRFYDMRKFSKASGLILKSSLYKGINQTITWIKNN